jgi:hypothetical protein
MALDKRSPPKTSFVLLETMFHRPGTLAGEMTDQASL